MATQKNAAAMIADCRTEKHARLPLCDVNPGRPQSAQKLPYLFSSGPPFCPCGKTAAVPGSGSVGALAPWCALNRWRK